MDRLPPQDRKASRYDDVVLLDPEFDDLEPSTEDEIEHLGELETVDES
jgi:hypothetical protein